MSQVLVAHRGRDVRVARVRRAYFLALTLGGIVTLATVVWTALEIRNLVGSGTVTTRLLGVPFWHAERMSDHGSVVAPRIGVVLVFLVLPVLVAGVVYAVSTRSQGRRP